MINASAPLTLSELTDCAARGDYKGIIQGAALHTYRDLWSAAMTAHHGPVRPCSAEERAERIADAREDVARIIAWHNRRAA